MTEREWFAEVNFHRLIDRAGVVLPATERKRRLAFLAWCRAGEANLHLYRAGLVQHFEDFIEGRAPGLSCTVRADADALWEQAGYTIPAPSLAADYLLEGAFTSAAWPVAAVAPFALPSARYGELRGVLYDIFGPLPFRDITCDPAWLTDTVRTLARGIYEQKAFERMPILADALQDAGCESEDILNHCRDTACEHVRGCWVLDLLLGHPWREG